MLPVGNIINEIDKKNKLSVREIEIARLVCRGLSNDEVAKLVFISEKTIKFHLGNVYKKLGIKSRAKLIVLSFTSSILDDQD